MKMFKKAAALVMAAVLAVGVLAGCSSSGVTVAPEEEAILNQINQVRASQNSGLEPLTNDATLSAAAAKLLEEFAKTPDTTAPGGNGYSMDKNRVSSILYAAGVTKTPYVCNTVEYGAGNYYWGGSYIYNYGVYLAPVVNDNVNMTAGYYGYPQPVSSANTKVYLTRRATVSSVGSVNESNMGGVYGYSLALRNNVKMGIAVREINGETYMMVLYDVLV